MVRIEVCYFCSSRIYPGHGIVFARNDSKVCDKLSLKSLACSVLRYISCAAGSIESVQIAGAAHAIYSCGHPVWNAWLQETADLHRLLKR